MSISTVKPSSVDLAQWVKSETARANLKTNLQTLSALTGNNAILENAQQATNQTLLLIQLQKENPLFASKVNIALTNKNNDSKYILSSTEITELLKVAGDLSHAENDALHLLLQKRIITENDNTALVVSHRAHSNALQKSQLSHTSTGVKQFFNLMFPMGVAVGVGKVVPAPFGFPVATLLAVLSGMTITKSAAEKIQNQAREKARVLGMGPGSLT
jgi:hypothetical protein